MSYEDIFFQVKKYDPTENAKPIKKEPAEIPSVSLSNHTLYFASCCDGCILSITNDKGTGVFRETIPNGTTLLSLPADLSGECIIEIIQGQFCFWGYIAL